MTNLHSTHRKKGLDSFNFDLTMLPATKIGRNQLDQLLRGSASKVVNRTIENMKAVLEEAKDAYRELRKRQRHPNSYQVYNPRV